MSGSIVLSVMALLALIELYISIANPWKLMDKFYNFGCKYYRIGQMRQGIWGMAKTPVQFRIFTGIATALLATLCIYFSILLYQGPVSVQGLSRQSENVQVGSHKRSSSSSLYEK